MSLPALDNLVRIGQFKVEPRNVAEVRRMLALAHTSLADAQLSALSPQGRFTSAYNAAHAQRWQPCAGMGIAAKTVTPYSNVSHTP